MTARPYQIHLINAVQNKWAVGLRNIVMRLDTGGGKTFILASLVNAWQGGAAVIAHRHELVSQLSLTLAGFGISHNVVAATTTRRAIIAAHIKKTGRSFYDPGSRICVASVDTLRNAKGLDWWFPQVTLWVVDEGHHVVKTNKWHKVIEKFTNPYIHGLLPTATPSRADGRGLGADADGVAHDMVEGPPMRWLIEQGYLTDYRIVCPTSDMEVLGDVSANGDWSAKQLKEASERSHIVGDVVQSYRQFTPGRIGVTFTTDTVTATKMVAAYRAVGVRAELLTGETDPAYRVQMLRDLAERRLDQVVAIDVISEGLDLPAIEVVTFARITNSLQVYMQQFGRVLRPIYAPGFDLDTQAGRLAAIAASCKPFAWVIDHAGNTLRHQGPPDKPRVWSLDRRSKRGAGGGGIPMRVCLNVVCLQPYERFHLACPYCGEPVPEPETRGTPEAVDGDMGELDAETLAKLRAPVDAIDQPVEDYEKWLATKHLSGSAHMATVRRHVEAQTAQAELRRVMGLYGGKLHVAGRTPRETQKRFFLEFGVDVISAQALGRADAETLTARIERTL